MYKRTNVQMQSKNIWSKLLTCLSDDCSDSSIDCKCGSVARSASKRRFGRGSGSGFDFSWAEKSLSVEGRSSGLLSFITSRQLQQSHTASGKSLKKVGHAKLNHKRFVCGLHIRFLYQKYHTLFINPSYRAREKLVRKWFCINKSLPKNYET